MKKILTLVLLLNVVAACAAQSLLVAVQQYRDSVVIFNMETNAKTAGIKVGYKPHEVTCDPVSKKCFVTNFGLEDYDTKVGKPGNCISVIDPYAGKVINTIYTSSDTTVHNGPHGIKVRMGKQHELFVNVEIGGDSMLVYDLDNYSLKRKFRLPAGSHNFVVEGWGKELWVMAGANGVYGLKAKNGAIRHHAVLTSPVRGLVEAKDWLLASCKGEVYLLSKTDLSVIRHFANLPAGQLLYSAVTYDEKYIVAPAPFDNVVLVIDANTGDVVQKLQTGNTPLNVQLSGYTAYITHARDNYIAVVDLKTFKIINKLPAFGTNGATIVAQDE